VEYDLAARAVRRVDVAAVLHKDEQTPHIQALVVPISDAGRLSAYTYTGGREKLGAMQDSYARAMEPLGLERGVKGSVDIHETIKEWYAKIEAPTPAPEIARQDIEIERPGRIVPNPERWAGEQEARIAERVAPALEAAATALVKGQAATAEANITVLQGQVREIARERNTLREDYKALAAQVRAVPLESVIERLGGQVDRHNHAKYRLDGEHISITGGGNDLPAHPRTATLSLAPTAPPRRSPPRPRPARRSPATRLRTPPLPPVSPPSNASSASVKASPAMCMSPMLRGRARSSLYTSTITRHGPTSSPCSCTRSRKARALACRCCAVAIPCTLIRSPGVRRHIR